MGFTEAVKSVLRNWRVFEGRSRRSEYWWWVLATGLIGVPLAVIDMVMAWDELMTSKGASVPFFPLSTAFSLVVLLPNLSVTARRLHDKGRSGWWQAIGYALSVPGYVVNSTQGSLVLGILLPIASLIWSIVFLIWLVSDSHPGPNKYGPSPKYGSMAHYPGSSYGGPHDDNTPYGGQPGGPRS